MDTRKTNTLNRIINGSRNIVFFGGAGTSTDSGIPDFRGARGLYAEQFDYPAETILSADFFNTHTEYFYEFYRKHMLFPRAMPNKAHLKLAELEAAGFLSAVVTQNIDGLHQAAGSDRVLELHGSVHRNYCMECGAAAGIDAVLKSRGVPHCAACGGVVRPDVVLYGEPLPNEVFMAAINDVYAADTLIIGGTSLSVHPAAGICDYFRGGHLIVINKTPTPLDSRADLVITDGISSAFDAVIIKRGADHA